MTEQEGQTTNIYYNIHIEGDVTGSNFGSGSVTAENIAGGNINQANLPVWQASASFVYWSVPTMPNHFVGRDAQVVQLVQQLTNGQTLALSADGKPGVGKTTLAVALAHHGAVLQHFSDGVLWGGLGTNADPMRILGEWATALGHDLSHLPTPQERQRALQNILGNKKILLVLDDAWQVEPTTLLRCGGPHCTHLLTTRDKSIARAFAGTSQMNNVDTLPLADGVALLEQLAPEACASNPETAAQLVQAVGGLPLAIELLGGYLADPNAPERLYFAEEMAQAFDDLTIPAQRLQLASQRLGSLDAPTSLQATIELSLADLPAATQTAFYCLGAFAPKPATFSQEAARAVTEADNRQLATLIERNLLEPDGERLALHQTLADVAASHNEVVRATERHRDYYLQLANKDRNDWQTIEIDYEQMQWAWQHLPEDETVLDFVWALRIYQILRGLGVEQITWINRALQIAREQGLREYEGTLLNNTGIVYYNLGQSLQALDFFKQALPILREVGDRPGESSILHNFGLVYHVIGQHQQALNFYNQALFIRREIGNRDSEAGTLNNIGGVYDNLGQSLQALDLYNQALPIFREVGNRYGEATTLNNIGAVYRVLGQPQQALDFYNLALPIRREVGDRSGEASTLNNIGSVYDDLGQPQQALDFFNQALPILHEVGNRLVEATTLNNIGGIYQAIDQPQQALEFYNLALLIRREVSDRSGEAITLNNIGSVYNNNLGQPQKALGFYKQVLPIFREIGNHYREASTLNNIGSVYDNLGQPQQALDFYNQALPIFSEVGDRVGESITRFNMAVIFHAEGQLEEAVEQLQQVVAIKEQISHPDLESDRAFLAQVEAELAAQGS